jgi:hypothetical protein
MTIHIIDVSPITMQPQSTRTITAEAVKAFLDRLLYGRTTQSSNSLEGLALVDNLIDDPTFPKGDHSRTIALGAILTDWITDELLHHRDALGIQTLVDPSFNSALQAIAQDGQRSNRELMGWSWLYYRYVRIELCLTPRDFCGACHISERTLTRYQGYTLQRLAEKVVKYEWKAKWAAENLIIYPSQ